MILSALTWSPDSVWLLLQKAWWFLVVLGVLVAFHELGHFLAARWVGVKVLKFSLGFGPKIFGRRMGDTEYLVSAFRWALVKLFGEDETEAVTRRPRPRLPTRACGEKCCRGRRPGFNFISLSIFAGWLATGSPLLCRHSKIQRRCRGDGAGSPAIMQVADRDRITRLTGAILAR